MNNLKKLVMLAFILGAALVARPSVAKADDINNLPYLVDGEYVDSPLDYFMSNAFTVFLAGIDDQNYY